MTTKSRIEYLEWLQQEYDAGALTHQEVIRLSHTDKRTRAGVESQCVCRLCNYSVNELRTPESSPSSPNETSYFPLRVGEKFQAGDEYRFRGEVLWFEVWPNSSGEYNSVSLEMFKQWEYRRPTVAPKDAIPVDAYKIQSREDTDGTPNITASRARAGWTAPAGELIIWGPDLSEP